MGDGAPAGSDVAADRLASRAKIVAMSFARQVVMVAAGWGGLWIAGWAMGDRLLIGIPAVIAAAGVVWALHQAGVKEGR